MFNLRAIANSATQIINPDFIGDLLVSTGYTTSADGTRTPSYTTIPNLRMQVQAVSGQGTDGPALQHLDSLNIQGTMRSVWIQYNVEALDRPAGKGGEVLMIPTGLTPAPKDTWLCVQMVESWDRAGWTHFIIQLQNPPLDQ